MDGCTSHGRRLKGKGLTLKQGNLKSLIPGEGGSRLPVAE